MILSADAILLSKEWARLFHPWMWNRAQKSFTPKGRDSALLAANQDQIQYALERGWPPQAIQFAFREAKQRGEKILHVYHLLVEQQYGILALEQPENLLGAEERYYHPMLYTSQGLLRSSFTLQDVMRHVAPRVTDTAPSRRAVTTLIHEWGLDRVLYAIDLAIEDGIKLRSAWGLSIFMPDATELLALRVRHLEKVRQETERMRIQYDAVTGQPTYAHA